MTKKQPRPFPWADQWPEIYNQRVRDAFARVPREEFVDPAYRRWADRDAPLPIGQGQTISQPFVVALMTQAIDPKPGKKVLEIGTGSGFQTAILCELTRDEDHPQGELVYSVERYPELAKRAVSRLSALGYAPRVRTGDGAAGWPEVAPFDCIIVSAAAPCLPRPLWSQLDEGGRIVLPIGGRWGEQLLWLLTKHRDRIQRRTLGPVRFVPLVSPLLDDPENCVDFDF